MAALLAAKAKADRGRLQRAFLGWVEWVDTKDGAVPERCAKRARSDAAVYERDDLFGAGGAGSCV
jgi:hypothetical protein